MTTALLQRPFCQVDVFTDRPYLGNPLAVVLDGSGLDDAQMRAFAHWTNLSETTFLLPPTEAGRAAGADYRVRIYTPGSELPFAGHPTLGSCHAWLEAGGVPRQTDTVVQECGVGLVRIQRKPGGLLAFAAPPLKRSNPGPMQLAQVANALGLKSAQILAAQWLDNGPVWLGLLLDSVDTVLALEPDLAALKVLGHKIGIAAIHPEQDGGLLIARASREARAFVRSHAVDAQVEVRAFAPAAGIAEDPVTGSFNAGLAQWLMADEHIGPRYIASQGTCLGRDGRVHLERDSDGQVWVGGASVTCIRGQVLL